MIKLHLVGFTTDLKNLVLARRKGAKTGGYLVKIDERLKRTLEEVAKLGEVAKLEEAESAEPEVSGEQRVSKLTPKEIQNLLRRGKSPEEVAKLAETDVGWVQRFTTPIEAEKAGVIDTVKTSAVAKPRLGPSALPVGEAVDANLREKRVQVPNDILDDGWSAVRRNDYWEVAFRYVSRGRVRVAKFSYDPEERDVEMLNKIAGDIGWRSPEAPPPPSQEEAAASGRGDQKKTSSKSRSAASGKKRGSRRKSKGRSSGRSQGRRGPRK